MRWALSSTRAFRSPSAGATPAPDKVVFCLGLVPGLSPPVLLLEVDLRGMGHTSKLHGGV